MRVFKADQGAIKPLWSLQFGTSYSMNSKNFLVGFPYVVKDILCVYLVMLNK